MPQNVPIHWLLENNFALIFEVRWEVLKKFYHLSSNFKYEGKIMIV